MPTLTDKIETIVAGLSLVEKASLCSGKDDWSLKSIDRLSTPSAWVADGPHGLRRAPASNQAGYGDQLPATCYPTASALAATWDPELIEELGGFLGRECLAQGVDVILGPGVNIKRSPLGGRNFEYFSEDPRLAGKIGAAYVRGVQGAGVGCSLKHFACNSQEIRRMMVDSRVGERALREIYLANFEIAVKEGRPWTVMASYNPVNGTDATANARLLTEILREEWGFEGIVVSDWVSVYDRPAGIAAGLDLEMPGNGGFTDAKIVQAVKDGMLDEGKLDAVVKRVLRFAYEAAESRKAKGAADPAHPRAFDAAAHHAFARRAAGESIVLLKNEGGLLPLAPGAYKRIALLGDFAERPRYQGNGSSEVKPTRLDRLVEEMRALYGKACAIEYAPGFRVDDDDDLSLIAEAAELAERCEVAVIHAGLPLHYESEGIDRGHIDLPPAQVALIRAVAKVQPKLVVVLANGSAIAMPWIDAVPAALECWLGGQAGAGAIADAVSGRVNPSGKLAETFPARLEDTAAFLDLPSPDLALNYSEGIFVGYRWHEKRKIAPLFPFGHGLSYSSFEYSALKLSASALRGGETLAVSCRVRNAGKVAGKEVVQLYLRDEVSSLPRPEKELKGFKKIALEAGEEMELSFEIGLRDLSYFDDTLRQWVAESGSFEVQIGSSSADIRLRATFNYASDQKIFPPFSERTCMRDWIRYPETRAMAIALVKPFFDKVPALFEGDYADFRVANTFFVDMPIIKYARLAVGEITEEAVREMVEKARKIPIAI